MPTNRNREWSIAIRLQDKPCPICGETFTGNKCPHNIADVERHENPPAPKTRLIKMAKEKPDPARQTTLPVPESAMHVFVPVMDALQQAEEIWGVTDTGDYIAMMEAVRAEIDVRIANAKALKARGL